MNTPAGPPPRSELVEQLLHQILGCPPAGPRSRGRAPATARWTAAAQTRQAQILVRAYGPGPVTTAYSRHLEAALLDQRLTAQPLQAYPPPAPATAAGLLEWEDDPHGYLCHSCRIRRWQVISFDVSIGRLCLSCARLGPARNPATVWEPALPPAHQHLTHPGQPADTQPPQLTAAVDGYDRTYQAGDAAAFLTPGPWMALASGDPDTPDLEITGTAGPAGNAFRFIVMMNLDPTPQPPGHHPYGFRYTASTLLTSRTAASPPDLFTLLDTITAGHQPAQNQPASRRGRYPASTTALPAHPVRARPRAAARSEPPGSRA